MNSFHYGKEVEISGDYNSVFTDPEVGKSKHLKISNEAFGDIYIKDDTPFKMKLSLPQLPTIYIVYFINTYCNENYIYLVRS